MKRWVSFLLTRSPMGGLIGKSIGLFEGSIFEKLAPLLLSCFCQFVANLRRAREFVDPMVRLASVDNRHRAGIIGGFLFVFRQARINFIAPDSPTHVE